VCCEFDPQSEAGADIDLALRNTASADLAYERVALVHDAKAKPLLKRSLFDLGRILERYQRLLPPDDADAFVLMLPAERIILDGDPERFSFALRSLLGYLLSLRPPKARLQLVLAASEGSADIRIEISGAPARRVAKLDRTPEHERDKTSDKIVYAEAVAVAAAAHGFEAVQAIVEAHGGRLKQSFVSDRKVCFAIMDLPLVAVRPRHERAFTTYRSEP
jgi:hypothetical protein